MADKKDTAVLANRICIAKHVKLMKMMKLIRYALRVWTILVEQVTIIT